jgi:hypothetical protein
LGFLLACVFVYLLKSPAVTGNPVVLEIVLISAGYGIMFYFPMIYLYSGPADRKGSANDDCHVRQRDGANLFGR